jgi:acyl-CoA thioesterase FadM
MYRASMSSAAYLSHAELARWELTAYNGMLQAMYQNNVNFLVVGSTIRYRKEIRPLWCQFQIDTTVCGIDSRNMWISHNFRLPAKDTATQMASRVMAQMIVQGVAVQGRNVIDPGIFLKEKVGLDAEVIDRVTLSNGAATPTILDEMLQRCVALEETMKAAAAQDDEKYKK